MNTASFLAASFLEQDEQLDEDDDDDDDEDAACFGACYTRVYNLFYRTSAKQERVCKAIMSTVLWATFTSALVYAHTIITVPDGDHSCHDAISLGLTSGIVKINVQLEGCELVFRNTDDPALFNTVQDTSFEQPYSTLLKTGGDGGECGADITVTDCGDSVLVKVHMHTYPSAKSETCCPKHDLSLCLCLTLYPSLSGQHSAHLGIHLSSGTKRTWW